MLLIILGLERRNDRGSGEGLSEQVEGTQLETCERRRQFQSKDWDQDKGKYFLYQNHHWKKKLCTFIFLMNYEKNIVVNYDLNYDDVIL